MKSKHHSPGPEPLNICQGGLIDPLLGIPQLESLEAEAAPPLNLEGQQGIGS